MVSLLSSQTNVAAFRENLSSRETVPIFQFLENVEHHEKSAHQWKIAIEEPKDLGIDSLSFDYKLEINWKSPRNVHKRYRTNGSHTFQEGV